MQLMLRKLRVQEGKTPYQAVYVHEVGGIDERES
jgi:hypothetical protein